MTSTAAKESTRHAAVGAGGVAGTPGTPGTPGTSGTPGSGGTPSGSGGTPGTCGSDTLRSGSAAPRIGGFCCPPSWDSQNPSPAKPSSTVRAATRSAPSVKSGPGWSTCAAPKLAPSAEAR